MRTFVHLELCQENMFSIFFVFNLGSITGRKCWFFSVDLFCISLMMSKGKKLYLSLKATKGFSGLPDTSVVKESTCNAGDPSSIPGLGRSAGEGIGYPL